MKALLLMVVATGLAQGADVTVRLTDGENASLLNLVSLQRLFETQDEIKPDVTTEAARVFKAVKPGVYSVVVWDDTPVWQPSPTFDQTILVEATDVEVHVRKSKPAHDFQLKLSPPMHADVKRLYKGFVFVPCRLQRLQGLNAPTFGYRWLLLSGVGEHEMSFPVEISKGDYLVTIPFPVAAEAWPPPRVPRQHLPQPLVAFRVTVADDLTANVEAQGMQVVIKPHTSCKVSQPSPSKAP
jgi:hypothetical protein